MNSSSPKCHRPVASSPDGRFSALDASATRGRRRILVIEDNVDTAESLREVLLFGGHEVEVAYNGPQGIAKAREFRPDVVLCDIGLPGMDGLDVARAFKSDETLRGSFLVALSGYALPEDLQCARAAGFEAHLAKPSSIEQFDRLLADLAPSHACGDPHPNPTTP
ncbi:MAG: response regulator [Polyangia bacterium]